MISVQSDPRYGSETAMTSEELKVYRAAYYQANRERIREVSAAYRLANRDKVLEAKARWYRANKERWKEYGRTYSEAHPEQAKARYTAYRQANPEKVQARSAAWQAAHPEARATYRSRRRARKAGNGGSHTTEQRRIKFEELGNRCFYCGISGKMTVDHQTPLSRGGTDNIDNLVPACGSCNRRKGTKTQDEFLDHFGG